MNSPDSFSLNDGWRRQLGPRLRILWVPKMLGTTLGIAAFFVAYFWILRHPFFPITIMPFTAVDRLIAFRPGLCRSTHRCGFTWGSGPLS